MTNEKAFEMIGEALVQRQELEKRWAKFEAQRYTEDRPKVNNDPWPNASNIRYPLADMIIEQKKGVYSQIIYSSESLAVFKALTPRNYPYANNLAPYFDFIIKEQTAWEEESVYCLDAGLQDGASWLKVVWDYEKQAPKVKWIENLMMILPSTAANFKEAPWITEVIHLSESEALKAFPNCDKDALKKLIATSLSDESNEAKNDTVGRLRERYLRRGINLSGKSGRLVVWEHHYTSEDGSKRIRTISPDNPKFDFKNDRAYPYWAEKAGKDGEVKKESEWMYEQFRREWTSPNQHSSRGIPEIVEEYEFLLSALWRMKHNVMSIVQEPMFTTASGLPPGSLNNYSMVPGGFLPGGITPVVWPAPPISFDEEMVKTRDIAERRMATPDTGLGRSNSMNDSRTAKEVSLMASLQQLSVNYESTPWKKFIRQVYRQCWSRIVQYKPETLTFYLNGTVQSLPPDALNGDYLIDVSWSGDNINKEYLAQQAFTLWKETLGNPIFNQQETAKNMLDHMTPGQTQRFLANPQLQKADMVERIANELDTMVSIGFPVRVKEDVDHYEAVLRTMQFIQAREAKGQGVDQQAVTLLSQYMAGHRDMLARTNPQQRKQLDMELTQMEEVMRQQEAFRAQAQAQQMAIPQQAAQPGAGQLPIPAPPSNVVTV